MASQRITRKRSVRAAVLAVHGTLKVDYVALLLPDVSRSYIGRCLSETERAEFNGEHLTQLGVADAVRAVSFAGERRAA